MDFSYRKEEAMPWKEFSEMEQRHGFVFKAISPGAVVSELCREYGISRSVGYKLINRYRQEGLEGIKPRSRRPRFCPQATSPEVICEIVSYRQRHPKRGGKKIRWHLERKGLGEKIPCTRTIDRILNRCGLSKRRRSKRRRWIPEGTLVIPEQSNDVWTVDFKGWWRTRDGKYCYPLTIRDEYSKYVLDIGALGGMDFKGVQKRFIACFERYGLPHYIRSDNGTPFASLRGLRGLTRLSVWWIKLGIYPERILPGCPQMNGGHERMHKDIKAEIQKKPGKDLASQQRIFDIWREDFNNERPHEALDMKTPDQCYERSLRRYPAKLPEYEYPHDMYVRNISNRGCLSWKRNRAFVSNALRNQTVGLKIEENDHLSAWFYDYYLGTTNLHFKEPLK
jgi:transposase InsO family protein